MTVLAGTHTILEPPLPFCMNVELSSMCNQRCIMCPLTAGNTLSGRNPGHMSEVTWRRVRAAGERVGQVQWIGYGEALLHPRALDYFAELDGSGVWSSLSTNGIRLTEEVCAALSRLEHLIHINVSIDSLDPRVYEQIRKTPLRKATAGLETLVRHFPRERISVGAVIMTQNVGSLTDLPAYLASLGLGKLTINVLHEHKGKHFAGELRGQETTHQQALDELRNASRRSGVQLAIDVPQRLAANVESPAAYDALYRNVPDRSVTRRCLLPWEFPFVDKDGNVFLCSNATSGEDEIMGSLLEEDFDTIWRNEKFQRVRRSLLEGRPLPASCARCTIQAIGEHPLNEYRAEISGPKATRMTFRATPRPIEIEVRNAGTRTWAPGTVRVGTVRPRDRVSPLRTPEWLEKNRAASNADAVPPDARTRLVLPIAPPGSTGARETFQLVLEGQHWIPNSEFTVTLKAPNPVLRMLRTSAAWRWLRSGLRRRARSWPFR